MVSENYKKIESKAFWYLERYASSSKNLKDYLRKKVRDTELNQDSEVIINQIITNLEKQNILNDAVFSESKSRTFINKGWSLSKIKFRLKQLGINSETIEICIDNIKAEESDIEIIAASKSNLFNGWRVISVDKIGFKHNFIKSVFLDLISLNSGRYLPACLIIHIGFKWVSLLTITLCRGVILK